MNFLKQTQFIILAIVLSLPSRALGQEYIVYKKQKGFIDTLVSHNIRMYPNQVETGSSDTVVHFYNFYCTSFPNIIPSDIDQRKQEVDTSGISTDLLVTAIVGYSPNKAGVLKKITKEELSKLKIVAGDEFVNTFFKMANDQMNLRSIGMQKNRTLKYKLIIDENGTYYLIDRPVLVLAYFVSDNLWYYPNEFKSGVLNASYRYNKLYTHTDFEKLDEETPYTEKIQKQLYDRAYPFRVDELNEFKLPVFSFWEWLSGEANLMVGNNLHRTYSPGLGTFSFLPKVGIVNATFKPSLWETAMPSDMSSLKIRSVNGVSPGEFAELLRNNLYKNMIIGAQ